jgi:hypothetical protein
MSGCAKIIKIKETITTTNADKSLHFRMPLLIKNNNRKVSNTVIITFNKRNAKQ